MSTQTRVLIVDRDSVAAQALQETLAGRGYEAVIAGTTDDAIDLLERERSLGVECPVGVAIADQDSAGASDGSGLIRRLHDGWAEVVPIVLSGFRKVESAVAVMRLGAADYLLKPVVESELISAVERAEQRHTLLVGHDDLAPISGAAESPEEPADPVPAIGDAARAGEPGAWTPMPLAEAMKAPEREILLMALEHNGWNRQKTAAQLEINRTTLYKKIRLYRLDEPAA